MSTGCLCWLDKQNTVAAYFTSVPVCQAVCGEERFASKHNGEFDTVVCYLAQYVPLAEVHKDSLTILSTFTPTTPSRSAPRAPIPHHVKMFVDCELFFLFNNAVVYLALPQCLL